MISRFLVNQLISLKAKKTAVKSGLVVVLVLFVNLSSQHPSTAIEDHKSASFSQLFSQLKVSPELRSNTYDREQFPHWIDADGDGCDTREEVLRRQSKNPVTCDLAGGSWVSAYDGTKTNNPSKFDIDHLIPLKEAWESGAYLWNSETRKRFANDLDYSFSLIAVSASSNRSKSDRDPTAWLPPAKSFTCQYVGRWVAVKYRWGLSVDTAEKKALSSKLASCGTRSKVAVPTKAKIVKGSASPQAPSGPSPSTGTGGLDPQFASCAEAKRNGYNRSYTKGVNPEYEWYQDRDGDGVVCE